MVLFHWSSASLIHRYPIPPAPQSFQKKVKKYSAREEAIKEALGMNERRGDDSSVVCYHIIPLLLLLYQALWTAPFRQGKAI